MLRSLVILLALAIPTFASAGSYVFDDKEYSGTMCLTRSRADEVYRSSTGRMQNVGAWTQSWRCPVLKDTSYDLLGDMHVVDGSTTAAVSCTLISRTIEGQYLAMSSRSTGAATVGIKRLKFHSWVKGFGRGMAYYSCSIPVASGVMSYEIDEDFLPIRLISRF
jgi:hypothetical protein